MPSNDKPHPNAFQIEIFGMDDSNKRSNTSLNLRKSERAPQAVPIYEGDNSGGIHLARISDLSVST